MLKRTTREEVSLPPPKKQKSDTATLYKPEIFSRDANGNILLPHISGFRQPYEPNGRPMVKPSRSFSITKQQICTSITEPSQSVLPHPSAESPLRTQKKQRQSSRLTKQQMEAKWGSQCESTSQLTLSNNRDAKNKEKKTRKVLEDATTKVISYLQTSYVSQRLTNIIAYSLQMESFSRRKWIKSWISNIDAHLIFWTVSAGIISFSLWHRVSSVDYAFVSKRGK
jgi:hypothetical protein